MRITAAGWMLGVLPVLVFAAGGSAQEPKPRPHQGAGQASAQPADMSAKCQAMMATRQTMMAEVEKADRRLDELVARMQSATGQEKVDATAAVAAEIVAQRKAMRERMTGMQEGMMGHMMEHAQEGGGGMAMCPMMKGGMKQ